jgi:hypothetical protein
MSELKTCFKRVDYDLAGLLHYLDIGDIGLPDIQRPFVWSFLARTRCLLIPKTTTASAEVKETVFRL